MKTLSLCITLLLLVTVPAFGMDYTGELNGDWDCTIADEPGTGKIIFSDPNKSVTFYMPDGKAFTFQYTARADGDKNVIVNTLKPATGAHPMRMAFQQPDAMTVSFPDEPRAPRLQCQKSHEQAPVGH